MTSRASLLLLAAVLALMLAASRCAPAGVHDSCAAVRSSSLELNRAARTASVQARNGSKDYAETKKSLVWMDDKALCDPKTLKQKSKPCVHEIQKVLAGYWSALDGVSRFHSCSKFVEKLEPLVRRLHEDIGECSKSKSRDHQMPQLLKAPGETVEDWEEVYMCHYTLDRLFSFSILTARVFAVGDPAGHADGSAQKC